MQNPEDGDSSRRFNTETSRKGKWPANDPYGEERANAQALGDPELMAMYAPSNQRNSQYSSTTDDGLSDMFDARSSQLTGYEDLASNKQPPARRFNYSGQALNDRVNDWKYKVQHTMDPSQADMQARGQRRLEQQQKLDAQQQPQAPPQKTGRGWFPGRSQPTQQVQDEIEMQNLAPLHNQPPPTGQAVTTSGQQAVHGFNPQTGQTNPPPRQPPPAATTLPPTMSGGSGPGTTPPALPGQAVTSSGQQAVHGFNPQTGQVNPLSRQTPPAATTQPASSSARPNTGPNFSFNRNKPSNLSADPVPGNTTAGGAITRPPPAASRSGKAPAK